MAKAPPDLRTRLPRLNARALLRVLVSFVICLPLWYLVREPYLASVVYSSVPVLRQVIDTQGLRLLKIEGDTIRVFSGLQDDSGGIFLNVVGMLQRDWAMLVLGFLLCLTPWRRLGRCWYWAIGAVAVVWLSQVITFGLHVTAAMADVYADAGRELLSPAAADFAGVMSEYLAAARPFIACLVVLPIWLAGSPDSTRSTGSTRSTRSTAAGKKAS